MKILYKIILVSLVLAIGSSTIPIIETSAQTDRKTIHIATVEYPPAFFKDGTGIAADMLTEVLDKMGYDISINIYPLGRTIQMVNNGSVECAFLFPQTDPKTTVSIPLYYSATVFVYKKSRFPNGVSYDSLSDLKEYKIGSLTNSKWFTKLLQENAGLKLDFAPANDINLKKLYAGRIDLLPLSHLIANSLIESVFPDQKEDFELTDPFSITPVCLIFSNSYPDNHKVIDHIKRKVAEMDLQSIIQKYFGSRFRESVIPSYMLTGEINHLEFN